MPKIQDPGHCHYSNEPLGLNGYYLELPPIICEFDIKNNYKTFI